MQRITTRSVTCTVRAGLLGLLTLGLALCSAGSPASAQAQDKKNAPKIYQRINGTETELKNGEVLLLRPNVVQPLTLVAFNPDPLDKNFLVKLIRFGPDGAPEELGRAAVPVEGTTKKPGGGRTTLTFAPPPPPTAATPPAVTSGTAGAPPAAPALPELFPVTKDVAGVKKPIHLQVVVLEIANLKDEQGPAALELNVPVRIQPPSYYVTPSNPTYDPAQQQISVKLTSADSFRGPDCPAELVLTGDDFPGLKASRTSGEYTGVLKTKNTSVTLSANKLKFVEGASQRGIFYVAVDQYPRALTFEGELKNPLANQRIKHVTELRWRVVGDSYVAAGPKYTCRLEVDNPPAASGITLDVQLGRGIGDSFGSVAAEKKVQGAKEEHVFVDLKSPKASFAIKTEAKDWNIELNTAGIYGDRTLRVVLGYPDPQDPKMIKTETKDIPVTLDNTPPEIISFDSADKRQIKGTPLRLVAKVADETDDASAIKRVVFFAGKATADIKDVPKEAPQVEAKLAGKGTFVAQLPVATDKKGTVDVSVQVEKKSGLKQFGTVTIELVDPPPSKTTIEGVVLQGTTPRPQPNVTVVLRDERGVAKDTTTTDKMGKYTFKDVAAGSYRVTASRTASNTKGEVSVSVKEGEKKTAPDLTLTR